MPLSLRERSQKVASCLEKKEKTSLSQIAKLTGLPTSSVHRHRQGLERRDQNPESWFWETPAGGSWLKRLVLAMVYYFGIKQGVGAPSLSECLKSLGLERHVGLSVSTLTKLKRQMQESICAYEAGQKDKCVPPAGGEGICVGGDETFFGLPILVMMELASGYILTEAECESRSYDSWSEQIQSWWTGGGWHCRYMVSDGAKALIKLATEGLSSVSVADLFHLLRSLAQPMGSAIGRHKSQLEKEREKLQQKFESAKGEEKKAALTQSIEENQNALEQVVSDQQLYHQALQELSAQVHPFELNGGQWRMATELSNALAPALETLSTLAPSYGGEKSKEAISAFSRQIPHLATAITAWWQWTRESLSLATDEAHIQAWVIGFVLPWLYWSQQADKTRQPLLKQRYQQACAQAQARLSNHPLTQQMDESQLHSWFLWSQSMVAKYQRTSSAIEGRNGSLSRLHHGTRGFTVLSLRSLTIIHNFDLKRPDGSTAAQRLFRQSFPDLFEWVLQHMGDLPLARLSHSSLHTQPWLTLDFPA